MLKRAIVVGASSGIGAALVRRLCAEGYLVAAVARREPLLSALATEINTGDSQRCWTYVHDVNQTEEVVELFGTIVSDLDGLDLIVYAAGIMPAVAEDQYDGAIDRSILSVNLMGAVSWLNVAAERFQVQRSGTLVGIGSVAGDRGRRRPGPAYAASKAALHTYLEALRNRLSQHGVHVLTVKPGPVHTPMTAGLDKLPFVIEADEAAHSISRAIARQTSTAYVPMRWGLIMAIIKLIPSFMFRRTDI